MEIVVSCRGDKTHVGGPLTFCPPGKRGFSSSNGYLARWLVLSAVVEAKCCHQPPALCSVVSVALNQLSPAGLFIPMVFPYYVKGVCMKHVFNNNWVFLSVLCSGTSKLTSVSGHLPVAVSSLYKVRLMQQLQWQRYTWKTAVALTVHLCWFKCLICAYFPVSIHSFPQNRTFWVILAL